VFLAITIKVQKLDPIDFHYMDKKLHYIFLVFPVERKVMQFWNGMRVIK